MTIVKGIDDFYFWWTDILHQMLPGWLRPRANPSQINLTVQRDGIFMEPATDSGLKFESTFCTDVTVLSNLIKSTIGRSGLSKNSVRLIMSPDRYLKRKLSDFRLPRSRLESMAVLDMQGAIPFKQEDVYILWNDTGGASVSSSYVVIKKSILQPVFDQLRKIGITVSDIRFPGDDAAFVPDQESVREILPVGRLSKLPDQFYKLGKIVLIAGVLLTVGHVKWRHYQANQVLDLAIENATQKSAEVRRLLASRNEAVAQLVAIRQEKKEAVPVVVIIEELARIIPDKTWITDLEIENGKVNFSGFSASAAKLIPLLENSKFFSEPTFRSPVLRVSVQVGERFSISTKVEQANG